ncbi:MAG: hypothetical protein K9L30_18680 [Desulfobacterales bacterium]|nr:hypothetical protein [Desulfobacterales bacterium]
MINFIKKIQYRLKGIEKIQESDSYIFVKCLKCKSNLRIHKWYGKLHVACNCGHLLNIDTGKNIHLKQNIDDEERIYKGLQVLKCDFVEKEGAVIISGKLKNNSVFFLKNIVGAFTLKESKEEILFFPEVNLNKSNNKNYIEPFEEVEFSHYLSKEEAVLARKSNFSGFNLTFLQFDKSNSA